MTAKPLGQAKAQALSNFDIFLNQSCRNKCEGSLQSMYNKMLIHTPSDGNLFVVQIPHKMHYSDLVGNSCSQVPR